MKKNNESISFKCNNCKDTEREKDEIPNKGRPLKASKKRGRPPKKLDDAPPKLKVTNRARSPCVTVAEKDVEKADVRITPPAKIVKKRGRPPKSMPVGDKVNITGLVSEDVITSSLCSLA